MSEAHQAEWRRHSQLKRVAVGQRIVSRGDVSASVFTLLSGAVRVFHRGANGGELMAKLLVAPALFGEKEVIVGTPHVESVEVLKPAEVLVTPRETFLRSLRENPMFALGLLEDLSRRQCISAQLEGAVTFQDVESRLASVLLSYARVFGVRDGTRWCIAKRTEVSELAHNLGVNRKSIQRTLDSFVARGLIARDKKLLYLLDRQGLAALADEGPFAVDHSLTALRAETWR